MDDLDARLLAAGQPHLVDALRRMHGDARERLEAEIRALDLERLGALIRTLVRGDEPVAEPGDL
jgi:hypothetical protein